MHGAKEANVERGSSKHGSRIDDEMADESEPLQRAEKENRADEAREHERAGREDADDAGEPRGTAPDPHLAGSQSSADVYPHQEMEEGGASHPKPKDGGSGKSDEEREEEDIDNPVDEASADSFPASDSPAW
ncbi:MAG TPA: hypothetical protein VM573_02910 [Actinomycetota bacterium]|nr:hypothetical protein [Actinomycetota bacterium]